MGTKAKLIIGSLALSKYNKTFVHYKAPLNSGKDLFHMNPRTPLQNFSNQAYQASRMRIQGNSLHLHLKKRIVKAKIVRVLNSPSKYSLILRNFQCAAENVSLRRTWPVLTSLATLRRLNGRMMSG